MRVKRYITSNADPKNLIRDLVDGNVEYRNENRAHFEKLKTGQKPDITLVTCCDSRIPPEVFGLDSLNELFVIRNIGNQFRHSEGSIKYSILHLKTPLVIYLGHTGCGAVQAAMGDYRKEDDAIQKEVVGLTNSLRRAREHDVEGKAGDDDILKNSMYSEINVDHQITKTVAEFNIKPHLETETITVIGMMFDIHGLYGEDSAHVHVTNVNGETDIEKIKEHALFEQLSDEEKDKFIKRLVKP